MIFLSYTIFGGANFDVSSVRIVFNYLLDFQTYVANKFDKHSLKKPLTRTASLERPQVFDDVIEVNQDFSEYLRKKGDRFGVIHVWKQLLFRTNQAE